MLRAEIIKRDNDFKKVITTLNFEEIKSISSSELAGMNDLIDKILNYNEATQQINELREENSELKKNNSELNNKKTIF